MKYLGKKDVKIILGSNYGDEGKGLATHYFSKIAHDQNKKCVNILFSGGCQRGHTVELKDGTRHVFHTFGSGSFDGADTFLDDGFVFYPLSFAAEEAPSTNVFISPKCRVTTPYDVFLNQLIAQSRGKNWHGTCGLGVWETMRRYETDGHALDWNELIELTDSEIIEYLYTICYGYYRTRLEIEGIKEPVEYSDLTNNSNLIKRFMKDIRYAQEHSQLKEFDTIMNEYDYIIFEGSQGLAIDGNNKRMFPHVTAGSTTSLIPAIKLLAYRNLNIETCYVTRSYFTRHGAGALPTECNKSAINKTIVDMTNVPNEFQGEIRYGWFDRDGFLIRIYKDKHLADSIIEKPRKNSVFITHLNEYEDPEIIEDLKYEFDNMYLSYTKYAEDVIVEKSS